MPKTSLTERVGAAPTEQTTARISGAITEGSTSRITGAEVTDNTSQRVTNSENEIATEIYLELELPNSPRRYALRFEGGPTGFLCLELD